MPTEQRATSSVTAAVHTVSEVAAAGTSLSNYDTTIVCRDSGGGGAIVAQGTGTSLPVTVGEWRGDRVCDQQCAETVMPPGPGQVELEFTKVASVASAIIGDTITSTSTVSNAGPDTGNERRGDRQPPGRPRVRFRFADRVARRHLRRPGVHDRLVGGGQVGNRHLRDDRDRCWCAGERRIVTSADDDTNPDNNHGSDVVYVEVPPETTTVVPLVDCVAQLPGGVLEAHFGYLNPDAASVVDPARRKERVLSRAGRPGPAGPVRAGPRRRHLPVRVQRHTDLDAGSSSASASASSPPCQGTLRIDKSLSPADDPARFDLQIDGSVAGTGANVTNQGTTGDVAVVAVPSGTLHLVEETAAAGTNLSNYETTIVCRQGGGPDRSSPAAPALRLLCLSPREERSSA